MHVSVWIRFCGNHVGQESDRKLEVTQEEWTHVQRRRGAAHVARSLGPMVICSECSQCGGTGQTFAVAEKSTEAALRALEICMSMRDQRSNLHTRRDVSADMGVRTRVQTSIAQVKRAPSLAPPKRRRRP